VDAAEAARYGLAERVVPAGDLDRAVHELVTSLLAIDRHAAAATKRLLLGARQRTLEEQAAAERSEQMIRLRTLFSAPAPRGSAGAGN